MQFFKNNNNNNNWGKKDNKDVLICMFPGFYLVNPCFWLRQNNSLGFKLLTD